MFRLALVLLIVPGVALADEGMWRPEQVTGLAGELREAGLRLDPAELSDPQRGPLAAVVNLSGCTASFVSPDGLIVTNHHCAAWALQYNSSEKADRYEAGYTARSRADELWAGPAGRVRVTLSEEDVTARFDAVVGALSDDREAFRAADALEKSLVASCEEDRRLRCQVAAYDGGAQRVLIRQLDLKDVRLVHAPPRAIGEFGGDVDNWMWPRHSGDWAFFRAYVAPSGEPAEHASANVPYRPSRWLTVSTEGVGPGDLVFVAGYPGRTSRHRAPADVQHTAGELYPWVRSLLDRALEVVRALQAESAEAKVKLTALEGGLANRSKYLDGLLEGFAKAGLVEQRRREGAELLAWVGADPERSAKYSAALRGVDEIATREAGRARADQLLGLIFRLPASIRAAGTIHWLAAQRALPDAERDEGWQARDWPELKASVEQVMRSQVSEADRRLLRLLLVEAARLPAGGRLAGVDTLLARFGTGGAVPASEAAEVAADRIVQWAFEAPSAVLDAAERTRLMDADRASVEALDDRLLQLAAALYDDRVEARDRAQALEGASGRLWPVAMAAVRERAGRPVYSDANSTLRVTWGTVRGYGPQEAVEYAPQTTVRGVLAKDTGKAPFDVPPEQRRAIEATEAAIAVGKAPAWSDRGLGTVPVNFLSTCDTTGGNSGSPTLDAQGRLIGLLFDGNFESMASDWVYDRVLNRSIHVDIRYALWALESFLGGEHLLREMGLLP